VITIAELQYGITAAADPLEQIRRRQRIHAVLDQFDVLPFDVPTADYFGAPATLVRQHGRNPRPRRKDLQIAATAARHELKLLTAMVTTSPDSKRRSPSLISPAISNGDTDDHSTAKHQIT
jgi:predicted nucleic acid-binding protein